MPDGQSSRQASRSPSASPANIVFSSIAVSSTSLPRFVLDEVLGDPDVERRCRPGVLHEHDLLAAAAPRSRRGPSGGRRSARCSARDARVPGRRSRRLPPPASVAETSCVPSRCLPVRCSPPDPGRGPCQSFPHRGPFPRGRHAPGTVRQRQHAAEHGQLLCRAMASETVIEVANLWKVFGVGSPDKAMAMARSGTSRQKSRRRPGTRSRSATSRSTYAAARRSS